LSKEFNVPKIRKNGMVGIAARKKAIPSRAKWQLIPKRGNSSMYPRARQARQPTSSYSRSLNF
jgi:hypothetical protein